MYVSCTAQIAGRDCDPRVQSFLRRNKCLVCVHVSTSDLLVQQHILRLRIWSCRHYYTRCRLLGHAYDLADERLPLAALDHLVVSQPVFFGVPPSKIGVRSHCNYACPGCPSSWYGLKICSTRVKQRAIVSICVMETTSSSTCP